MIYEGCCCFFQLPQRLQYKLQHFFFTYLLLEPLVRECDACHTSDRLVKVQMVQFLTRNLESSAIYDRLYNCNMSVSDM